MDQDARITLRLPAELHSWLTEQAKSARRSLNSEIVYRLDMQRQEQDDAITRDRK